MQCDRSTKSGLVSLQVDSTLDLKIGAHRLQMQISPLEILRLPSNSSLNLFILKSTSKYLNQDIHNVFVSSEHLCIKWLPIGSICKGWCKRDSLSDYIEDAGVLFDLGLCLVKYSFQ